MNANKTNVWQTWGFIGIFLVIVVALLFIPHFVRNDNAYVAFQCSFFLLMLVLNTLIKNHRFLYFLEFVCIVAFLIFDSLSLYLHSVPYMLIAYGFSIVFLILVIYELIVKVVNAPVVNTNFIFGAMIVYFLAGILCAKVYFLQNYFYPGSFHSFPSYLDFDHVPFSESYNIQFNLIYYSFCVITTLGFGDIVPIHNQAKALAVLEAMFGQLFVAIIIAKLVSVWRQGTGELT